LRDVRFVPMTDSIISKALEAYEILLNAPDNGTLNIILEDGKTKEWVCMGIKED